MQKNEKIIRKKPFWYRKEYHQPAPIPIKYDGKVIQEFWPQEESEWVLNCDMEEALKAFYKTLDKCKGDFGERDYIRNFNREYPLLGLCSEREHLACVRWKKEEFYKELIEYPLESKDIDHCLKAGLSIDYKEMLGSELTGTYKAVTRFSPLKIIFSNEALGKFINSPVQRHTLVHELIHVVFRVPSVLIERGEKETKAIKIEDVIDYEAQRICIQRPELVNYAIRQLKL